MGKIAFVFAGQGAQAPGMGFSLCRQFGAARAVFEKADAIRPGTSHQCFAGTEQELRETRNTQPCMFAVEMAAAAALSEEGIRADLAAGFSLGELAALSYAGAMDLETGMRLVARRGELMQQAAEREPTAMVAALRLDNETVEQLCARFDRVYPVNYNCPGQVSVSGDAGEIKAFSAAVKEAGGRAVPLKVSGAFHSPFMAEAAEAFRAALEEAALTNPAIPVYSDCTGEPYVGDVRPVLAKQIDHPVRWEKIVRNMIAAGADTFLELGPGKTLCGLIKKIDDSVRVFSVAEQEDVYAVQTEV